MAPLFHHARQKIGSSRVERRIKAERHFHRRWRSNPVRFWGREGDAVFKALVHRHVVPRKEFDRVQMICNRQRIQFMQAGHDVVIFDIRKAADVKNKLRSSAPGGQFVADAFYVSVGKT